MQTAAYQGMQPVGGMGVFPSRMAGQMMQVNEKPASSPYRLMVLNVPQYLQSDEFRNQFLKLEGCTDASIDKNESGTLTAHYVDFATQEMAEKCAATLTNWKGWGPKGLGFQRVGYVVSDLKRSAEGDPFVSAKQARLAQRDSSPGKQDGLSGLIQLANGVQMPVAASGGVPSTGTGGGLDGQAVGLYSKAGTVQQGRGFNAGNVAEGSHNQPRQGFQPSAAGGTVQPTATYAASNMNAAAVAKPPGLMGAAVSAPGPAAAGVQYLQMADGTMWMSVPQPAAAGSQAAPTVNQMPEGQRIAGQGALYSAAPVAPNGAVVNPVLDSQRPVTQGGMYSAGAPGPPNSSGKRVPPSGPSNMGMTAYPPQGGFGGGPRMQDMGDSQGQFAGGIRRDVMLMGPSDSLQQPEAPVEDAMPENMGRLQDGPILPPNATSTLYVEDVPTDMSKRELSHIFRPFGGFKEVRIVTKAKGDGTKYCFAFSEFENPECATAAMKCLHGYVFDPENSDLGFVQLRFAHQDRSKMHLRGNDSMPPRGGTRGGPDHGAPNNVGPGQGGPGHGGPSHGGPNHGQRFQGGVPGAVRGSGPGGHRNQPPWEKPPPPPLTRPQPQGGGYHGPRPLQGPGVANRFPHGGRMSNKNPRNSFGR